MSKSEIDKELKSIIPLNVYIEIEVSHLGRASGVTRPTLRIICIKKNLDDITYIITKTHEWVHLHHLIANEKLTQFMTFKYLYESDIDTFKLCALKLAQNVLENRYGEQYNCTQQIITYFNDSNSRSYQ